MDNPQLMKSFVGAQHIGYCSRYVVVYFNFNVNKYMRTIIKQYHIGMYINFILTNAILIRRKKNHF